MSDLGRLKRRKLRTVSVDYDGEQYAFHLRSLTALEWMQCTLASTVGTDVQPDLFARLVAWSLCDENGQPTHASEEGVVEVSEWPWVIVNALHRAVAELNNVNEEASKNLMSRAG